MSGGCCTVPGFFHTRHELRLGLTFVTWYLQYIISCCRKPSGGRGVFGPRPAREKGGKGRLSSSTLGSAPRLNTQTPFWGGLLSYESVGCCMQLGGLFGSRGGNTRIHESYSPVPLLIDVAGVFAIYLQSPASLIGLSDVTPPSARR